MSTAFVIALMCLLTVLSGCIWALVMYPSRKREMQLREAFGSAAPPMHINCRCDLGDGWHITETYAPFDDAQETRECIDKLISDVGGV